MHLRVKNNFDTSLTGFVILTWRFAFLSAVWTFWVFSPINEHVMGGKSAIKLCNVYTSWVEPVDSVQLQDWIFSHGSLCNTYFGCLSSTLNHWRYNEVQTISNLFLHLSYIVQNSIYFWCKTSKKDLPTTNYSIWLGRWFEPFLYLVESVTQFGH